MYCKAATGLRAAASPSISWGRQGAGATMPASIVFSLDGEEFFYLEGRMCLCGILTLVVGRRHQAPILVDIGYCSGRMTIALRLYVIGCWWGWSIEGFSGVRPWEVIFMWLVNVKNWNICHPRLFLCWSRCIEEFEERLRSWLAGIDRLTGYSRLDENQLNLRVFGKFFRRVWGDL